MKNQKPLDEKEGLSLYLIQDESAEDLRKDFDHVGVMVCWYRSYTLGDKHTFSTPDDFEEWWQENGKDGIRLPLFLMDHSGLSMSTSSAMFRAYDSNGWDWGQIGWIYVTHETMRKKWGGKGKRLTKKTKERATSYLVSEVKEYDQFLRGDVWGYVVENENGEHLDSCFGFYGHDYAESEAKTAFDYYVSKKQAERVASESAREMEDLCPLDLGK